MKYIITYVNPTHIHSCDHQEVYTSKTQVNAFVKRAKEYPGSYSIEHIEKRTAKGSEWLSW